MTLTLVLWLQNGQQHGQIAVPDRGGVPWDYRLTVCDDPAGMREAMCRPFDGPAVPTLPRLRDLRFLLTERGGLTNDAGQSHIIAAEYEYQLGRRRFHYLCTEAWVPDTPDYDNDLMPPHVREKRDRLQRATEAWRKDVALLEAGAFPGDPVPYAPVPADILLEQMACADTYTKLLAMAKKLHGGWE